MKKQLLLFSFLLIAFSGFSQVKQKTIGLLVAPAGAYQPGNKTFNFAYSGGIFYDHQFTRRSGLNTGAGLQLHRFVDNQSYPAFCNNCEALLQEGKLPEKIISRSAYLELPVNYTFTLNPESGSGFKALLFTGVTFSQLISWNSTYVYNNRQEIEKYPIEKSRFLQYSYLNLGFELRRNLGEHYAFAFGTKLMLYPPAGMNYFSKDGAPLPFTLNLKFGRNL